MKNSLSNICELRGYNRVYPASRPHPWRVERAEKSEWNKYYTDRYGVTESTPNGYFTAACGQLIYRADVLPQPYRHHLFACEPAQIDRLEMNHLLADLEQIQQRFEELEEVIAERCGTNEDAVVLSSMPDAGNFVSMGLACRVGRVERFPRSHSLANYWGITPGCRNSGERSQRLGSITKAGSSMARWLPAQVTRHALRMMVHVRSDSGRSRPDRAS